MPPAMRTVPSGSSVALWSERGLSIGVAGRTEPGFIVGAIAPTVCARETSEATRTAVAIIATDRRNGVMGPPFVIQTTRCTGWLAQDRRLGAQMHRRNFRTDAAASAERLRRSRCFLVA